MIVLGSANMDFVIRTDRAPVAGETVFGEAFQISPGGKGANQALAARRADARVMFVGCLGRDPYGDILYSALSSENIDLSATKRVDGNTGRAFITLEKGGENRIIVVPGANYEFHPADLPKDIELQKLLLSQLEIPVEVIRVASARIRAAGGMVILNASPISQGAKDIYEAVLDIADILVVNESEANVLLNLFSSLNLKDACSAALELARDRVAAVITLGSQGVVWSDGVIAEHTPSHSVSVVDTTGCGDAFVGVFASAIERGDSLKAAVMLGNAAGALAAMRIGTQSSLPDRATIEAFAKARTFIS